MVGVTFEDSLVVTQSRRLSAGQLWQHGTKDDAVLTGNMCANGRSGFLLEGDQFPVVHGRPDRVRPKLFRTVTRDQLHNDLDLRTVGSDAALNDEIRLLLDGQAIQQFAGKHHTQVRAISQFNREVCRESRPKEGQLLRSGHVTERQNQDAGPGLDAFGRTGVGPDGLVRVCCGVFGENRLIAALGDVNLNRIITASHEVVTLDGAAQSPGLDANDRIVSGVETFVTAENLFGNSEPLQMPGIARQGLFHDELQKFTHPGRRLEFRMLQNSMELCAYFLVGPAKFSLYRFVHCPAQHPNTRSTYLKPCGEKPNESCM